MANRKVGDEIFLQAMEKVRFVTCKESLSFGKQESSHPQEQIIDFHGMTVKKAIALLEEILLRWQREKKPIQLIVGQGHHSPTLYAPLRQAIEKVLEEKGIPYTYEKGVIRL